MYLLNRYNIDTFLIRDPIYGYIEVPTCFKNIIDSIAFQRLRWINQLPLEQLVFPSAQHSRFEHSLGVMHLAMQAAVALLRNSKEKVEEALESSDLQADENGHLHFILLAGVSGLLHDIGHAPFSHTFEDACVFSEGKLQYDHEMVGYKIVRVLEKEFSCRKELFPDTVRVLNKKLEDLDADLSPVQFIVRQLIDGPIDVDKGDYLLRDSYHCGVSYGIYDHENLWRNIVLAEDFAIAVDYKAALEAWSLRIARYKMTEVVYHHHTRNITDCMLIEIILDAIDIIADKNSESKLLFPFESVESISSKDLHAFGYWVDSSFLAALEHSNKNRNLSGKVDAFMRRELYKRLETIDLNHYSEVPDDREQLFRRLLSASEELRHAKQCRFSFTVLGDNPIPIVHPSVQIHIQVRSNSKAKAEKYHSLAKHLGFALDDLGIPQPETQPDEDFPNEDMAAGIQKSKTRAAKLYIYSSTADKNYTKEIKHKVHSVLQGFSLKQNPQ